MKTFRPNQPWRYHQGRFGRRTAEVGLAHTKALAFAYAVGSGIAGGIVTVVYFTFWGKVFGRPHLGKIQGAAQALTVVASAAGPLLLAECQRRTGSYAAFFLIAAPLVAVLGFLCWWVPVPSAEPSAISSEAPEPA